jgi:hypothetical protein
MTGSTRSPVHVKPRTLDTDTDIRGTRRALLKLAAREGSTNRILICSLRVRAKDSRAANSPRRRSARTVCDSSHRARPTMPLTSLRRCVACHELLLALLTHSSAWRVFDAGHPQPRGCLRPARPVRWRCSGSPPRPECATPSPHRTRDLGQRQALFEDDGRNSCQFAGRKQCMKDMVRHMFVDSGQWSRYGHSQAIPHSVCVRNRVDTNREEADEPLQLAHLRTGGHLRLDQLHVRPCVQMWHYPPRERSSTSRPSTRSGCEHVRAPAPERIIADLVSAPGSATNVNQDGKPRQPDSEQWCDWVDEAMHDLTGRIRVVARKPCEVLPEISLVIVV